MREEKSKWRVTISEKDFPNSHLAIDKTPTRIALRERFFISSLPGLTRQSMGSVGLLEFAVLFLLQHFGMDHRVKPGGDGEEGASPQCCAQRRGPLTPPSPRARGEGVASVALCGFDKASAGGEEQRNDRE
jgi:hypothetical protein